jgi:hypothetical protein
MPVCGHQFNSPQFPFLFLAFYVAPNRDEVMKMVEMNPFPTPNCDGVINKSGCFELKITDLLTGFWPSADG